MSYEPTVFPMQLASEAIASRIDKTPLPGMPLASDPLCLLARMCARSGSRVGRGACCQAAKQHKLHAIDIQEARSRKAAVHMFGEYLVVQHGCHKQVPMAVICGCRQPSPWGARTTTPFP